MILIVGAQASGKRTFAQSLGIDASEIAVARLDGSRAVCDVQDIVRAGLKCGDIARRQDASDAEVSAREAYDIDRLVASLREKDVVMINEVGSGVVPATPEDRVYRDQVGRVGVMLASCADAVVRMVCGIPIVLQGELPPLGSLAHAAPHPASTDDTAYAAFACSSRAQRMIDVVVMRHGRTAANLSGVYQGRKLDVPLCETGAEDAAGVGVVRRVRKVYVSFMKRARETARICFPEAQQVVVGGIEEMNFGAFEGRTHADMEADPAYARWLANVETERCPQGESREEFRARAVRALTQAICAAAEAGEREFVCVAHGGTIMAAFSTLDEHPRDYYDYYVGNACGYRAKARISPDGSISLCGCEPFFDLSFLARDAACDCAFAACDEEKGA